MRMKIFGPTVGSQLPKPSMAQNDPSKGDFIRNRTHWVKDNRTTLQWDGKGNDAESFAVGGKTYYKISDVRLTAEKIEKTTILLSSGEEVQATGAFNNGMAMIGDYLYAINTATYTGGGVLDIAFSNGLYACAIDGVYPAKSTFGTCEVHPLDEMFIPDSIARVKDLPKEFGGSWNDLADRPFGEEDSTATIEWDGGTKGRRTLVLTDALGQEETYYKISDTCPDEDKILGATIVYSDGSTVTVTSKMFSGFVGGRAKVGYLYFVSGPEVSEGNVIDYGVIGVYGRIINDVFPAVFTYGAVVVHPLDEKFIPESIARKTDIPSVDIRNADWNQNDSSQADYVKNRTHWAEKSDTTVIDQVVIDASVRDGVMRTSATYPCNVRWVDGLKYIVLWNGEEYACECQISTWKNDFGNGYDCFLGNLDLLASKPSLPNKGAGMPFVLSRSAMGSPEDGRTNIPIRAYAYASEAVTASVEVYGEDVHTLDEKYLPETVAHKKDVNWANIPDKPFGNLTHEYSWDGKWSTLTYAEPIPLFKVSDEPPKIEELIGGKATVKSGESTSWFEITEGRILVLEENVAYALLESAIDETVFATVAYEEYMGCAKGLYLAAMEYDPGSESISRYGSGISYNSFKFIEENVIPDTIARKSDITAQIEEALGAVEAVLATI